MFISFVPDKAHVRAKMLYASSANTIQRELGGSERFPITLFWTELDEVSPAGWHSYEKHIQASNPLTQEELSLQDVIDKETDQMQGTQGKKSHVHGATGLPLPCEVTVLGALRELSQKSVTASVCLVSIPTP